VAATPGRLRPAYLRRILRVAVPFVIGLGIKKVVGRSSRFGEKPFRAGFFVGCDAPLS
jgi:hypothetical protein